MSVRYPAKRLEIRADSAADAIPNFRPPGQLPPENTIDVWVIPLTLEVDLAVSADVLSSEEQSRATHFRFERDAIRFRNSHTALRLLIGRYLNRSAAELLFGASSLGKPHLADELSLRFNLAHSKDMAVMAFATCSEVGIDLEAVATEISDRSIAAEYFTSEESALVGKPHSTKELARRFLRLWTRKEAICKALGCGPSAPLSSIEVAQDDIVSVGVGPGGLNSYWRVEDLALGPKFVGAVAAPPGNWTVCQATLSPLALAAASPPGH